MHPVLWAWLEIVIVSMLAKTVCRRCIPATLEVTALINCDFIQSLVARGLWWVGSTSCTSVIGSRAIALSFVVFVHVVRVGLFVVCILCTGDAFVCGHLHRVTLIIFSSSVSHLAIKHSFKLLIVVHFSLGLLYLTSLSLSCCYCMPHYCSGNLCGVISVFMRYLSLILQLLVFSSFWSDPLFISRTRFRCKLTWNIFFHSQVGATTKSRCELLLISGCLLVGPISIVAWVILRARRELLLYVKMHLSIHRLIAS